MDPTTTILVVIAVIAVCVVIYIGTRGRESLVISPHVVDIKQFPYYHYTRPYRYEDGGAWPPNMFTRMLNWYPGFSTGTGWSYWMRPGMSYSKWPRNRWVNTNGAYYRIDNGGEKDRQRDYFWDY